MLVKTGGCSETYFIGYEHIMADRFDPGHQLTSVSPVCPDMNKSGQTPPYLFQHQLGYEWFSRDTL